MYFFIYLFISLSQHEYVTKQRVEMICKRLICSDVNKARCHVNMSSTQIALAKLLLYNLILMIDIQFYVALLSS